MKHASLSLGLAAAAFTATAPATASTTAPGNQGQSTRIESRGVFVSDVALANLTARADEMKRITVARVREAGPAWVQFTQHGKPGGNGK
jgi:hypothetical protein